LRQIQRAGAVAQPVEASIMMPPIDLTGAPMTVRLDAATPAAPVVELVVELRVRTAVQKFATEVAG
jgi:hypothetical protein